MWKILKKVWKILKKSVENLEKSVENLEKSVENLEKKCEKQFQNRPGSLYRPLKQLGENSEYSYTVMAGLYYSTLTKTK